VENEKALAVLPMGKSRVTMSRLKKKMMIPATNPSAAKRQICRFRLFRNLAPLRNARDAFWSRIYAGTDVLICPHLRSSKVIIPDGVLICVSRAGGGLIKCYLSTPVLRTNAYIIRLRFNSIL
jgi:hypothetical protein